MNKEDIIKGLRTCGACVCRYCPYDKLKGTGTSCRMVLNSDAIELIEKTGWIPISERTPEPEGLFSGSYVIVCDKYGQVFPARYVKRILRGKEIIRWHEYDFRTYTGPDIVAWMPKPEKYIGGDQ